MIRVFFKLGSRQTSTTDTTTVRCSSAYLPNRRKLPTFLQNGQMGVSLPSLIKSFANLIGVEELYLYVQGDRDKKDWILTLSWLSKIPKLIHKSTSTRKYVWELNYLSTFSAIYLPEIVKMFWSHSHKCFGFTKMGWEMQIYWAFSK